MFLTVNKLRSSLADMFGFFLSEPKVSEVIESYAAEAHTEITEFRRIIAQFSEEEKLGEAAIINVRNRNRHSGT